MNWCHNTKCPAPNEANMENCCLHHVNVHSCPQEHVSFILTVYFFKIFNYSMFLFMHNPGAKINTLTTLELQGD